LASREQDLGLGREEAIITQSPLLAEDWGWAVYKGFSLVSLKEGKCRKEKAAQTPTSWSVRSKLREGGKGGAAGGRTPGGLLKLSRGEKKRRNGKPLKTLL